MGTFITSPTTAATDLFPDGDKSPAPGVTLRPGTTYDNYLRAIEANALRDALMDARTEARGRVYRPQHHASLSDAVTAAAADASGLAEIEVSAGFQAVTDNLTIPVDVGTHALAGGTFAVSSGKTLTINGPFRAARGQVFSGSGSVAFGAGAVDVVHPEWFGFATGATAAVNTTALQAALNSVADGGTVQLPTGTYSINEIALPLVSFTLQGHGNGTVLSFVPSGSGSGWAFSRSTGYDELFTRIRGFRLNGTSAANGGINLGNVGNGKLLAYLEHLYVIGFTKSGATGVYLSNCYDTRIHCCRLYNNYDGAQVVYGNVVWGATFEGTWFDHCSNYGLKIVGNTAVVAALVWQTRINKCVFQHTAGGPYTVAGLYLEHTRLSQVTQCHFEDMTRGVVMVGRNDSTYYGRNTFAGMDSGQAVVVSSASHATRFQQNQRTTTGGTIADSGIGTVFDADEVWDSSGSGTNTYETQIETVTTHSSGVITPKGYPTIYVAYGSAGNLDGIATASLTPGRTYTIVFSNTNVTVRHGQTGAANYEFNLRGAVDWKPRAGDTLTVIAVPYALNGSAGASLLEVSRSDLAVRAGTATLGAGGTVTVSTAGVRSSSRITVSRNTPAGTLGTLSAPVASIVDGTSFVINSTDANDTSTVNWEIRDY